MSFAGGAVAIVAGSTSGTPRSRGDIGPVRYNYGEHPSQYAEITLPARSDPAPVVVIIHGGYWSARYGAELGRPLAADLAGRGFAAVNVEYRRVGDSGGWPQSGQDVAAALEALPSHSLGMDLTKVVALGHSAGGQLAGWLASRRNGAVPLAGLVLQAGVLDLARGVAEGLGGGAIAAFLGGTPTEKPNAYAQASPIALVPLRVPSLCVHGTADTLVPIRQSQDFVEAAHRAGDDSQLESFDGGHFELITVGTRAWSICVDGLHRLTGT